jgi:T4 RnlA family RNA ligase
MPKYLPSYEDCVEMCSGEESPFYESKMVVDGYNVSIFNYRLAQYNDFVKPLENKPEVNAYEMRGLTFVFNKDGSLYKRFLLLEKFFNLNQVPESMYSIVKNYKIKFVNDKEDGSIASFIQLPNGKIVGKSKMGFDNDQANGINKIYNTNHDIKHFVDYCMENDIVPIFEYVAPSNRIVLRYSNEELILLRLRDNKTGKHIDIKNYLDKLGSIKVAPFKDDFKDLDSLIELTGTEIDKEGYVVQAEDKEGNDFFFKLKTPWYMSLHGLLTDDIYKENIIIGYILDDKIDDILGQIPETEFEARDRINRIIKLVKKSISEKVDSINRSYQVFLEMNRNKKEYALKYRNSSNFPFVMEMDKDVNPYDLAKKWLGEKTKRLLMARSWLKKEDPELFFKNSMDLEDQ